MNIKECFIKHKNRTPINLLNCTSFSVSEKGGLFYIDFHLISSSYLSWPFNTKNRRDEVYKNLLRNYTNEIFDEV